MPIEIKLTDIENLTTEQITGLYNYLMFSSHNVPNTEPEPKEDEDQTFEIVARPVKKRKKRQLKEKETVFITGENNEAIEIPRGEAGQIFNNATRKWEDRNISGFMTFKEIEQLIDNASILQESEPPPPPPDHLDRISLPGYIHEKDALQSETTEKITCEETICFVLESVREKKLTFEKVMQIVNQYGIPNLNSLEQYPELILPIYNTVKESINVN